MLEKTARLEAIQFDHANVLQVRFQKRIALDGETLKEEWHRTAIPPGNDVERQMALVNDHLGKDGYAPVPAVDIATISAAAASHHTPAIVAAYQAALAETLRQVEGQGA